MALGELVLLRPSSVMHRIRGFSVFLASNRPALGATARFDR